MNQWRRDHRLHTRLSRLVLGELRLQPEPVRPVSQEVPLDGRPSVDARASSADERGSRISVPEFEAVLVAVVVRAKVVAETTCGAFHRFAEFARTGDSGDLV